MNRLLIVMLGALLAQGGAAQEDVAEDAPAPLPVEAEVEEAVAEPRPRGDIITFKSGRQLSNVQVIRERRRMLEVEVLPELPPLMIPLEQVERIEYDERGPQRRREGHAPDGNAAAADMVASRLSPELDAKLKTPLTPEWLEFAGEDLPTVLTAIELQLEVPITIADEVRQMDPAALHWVSPPAETSLMVLLQDHLLTNFPDLRVQFDYDVILVSPRNDPQPAPENGAPASMAGPDAEEPQF